MIRRIVGADHDVEVLDMHQQTLPARLAVVVDGQLTALSTGSGVVDKAILRLAIA